MPQEELQMQTSGDDEVKAGGMPSRAPGPVSVDVSDTSDEEEEEKVMRNAWPPLPHYLFAWLGSPEGKQIAQEVSGLLGAFQKAALEKRHQFALFDSVLRYVSLLAIIGVACFLQYNDKLSPVMVSLLSGTAGFLLGRQQNK